MCNVLWFHGMSSCTKCKCNTTGTQKISGLSPMFKMVIGKWLLTKKCVILTTLQNCSSGLETWNTVWFIWDTDDHSGCDFPEYKKESRLAYTQNVGKRLHSLSNGMLLLHVQSCGLFCDFNLLLFGWNDCSQERLPTLNFTFPQITQLVPDWVWPPLDPASFWKPSLSLVAEGGSRSNIGGTEDNLKHNLCWGWKAKHSYW